MAERYIPEHRRTQFKAKNTFKPEELRRRREEQQVEIRKVKRDENLAKRRGITAGDGSSRPVPLWVLSLIAMMINLPQKVK